VELIVVSDIGPRLIRYAFVGKQNIFKEFIETLGKSGEKSWIPRGGHRLWVAPEVVPITYALDNGPVGVTIKGNDTIETVQPVEPETGLQKSIEVTLHIDGTVEVKHRIKNTNPESRELSPWILSYPNTINCVDIVSFQSLKNSYQSRALNKTVISQNDGSGRSRMYRISAAWNASRSPSTDTSTGDVGIHWFITIEHILGLSGHYAVRTNGLITRTIEWGYFRFQ
jgi:hypothetical protein